MTAGAGTDTAAAGLVAPEHYSADRQFSLRDDFPDVWYELNNPATVANPTRQMRASLPMTADDLPPHIPDLTVAQLTLFVVRDDALAAETKIASASHTTRGQTIRADEATTVDGVISTRRPGGEPWHLLRGTDPAGSWELEFENTPQVQNWFSAGLIQDVVLVFTLSGTTPPWT